VVVVSLREIRTDPVTGEDVILAEARRLERAPPRRPDPGAAHCPFCPGHESSTPPTLGQHPRSGPWVARAFANRAPALVVEAQPELGQTGPFEWMGGCGAHEVIVTAPEHAPAHTLPVDRTVRGLLLARERILDLRQDRRLRVLQWFRNQGAGGSASQPHPHAQVVGMPFVPERARRIAARARDHRAATGRSLLSDVVAAELRLGRRVLATRGRLVAFCPFAPSAPFECWIAPQEAIGHWADEREETVAHLGELLHDLDRRLAGVLGEVPTRAALLGAWEGGEGEWHLRLAPHLVWPGAFELGVGVAVHGVFPEESAGLLRAAAS
jgi:UDPglucose--hexose-1-phosphate uridylyltransferase